MVECCVLMSCYNGGKYIAEQIESILSQRDVNVKIIIRDDGSKDDTLDIIDKYSQQYPEKITIIRGRNLGIHKSFSQLIKRCPKTDFVAFSDQDDYWDQDKIISAILLLQSTNSDFYSCASRLCDEHLIEFGRNTSNEKENVHYQHRDNCILTPGTQGCTIVMTNKLREFLVEHDLPDCYGHDTWITIVAYYFFNCIYDKNTHMLYRQHNNSWTGNRKSRCRQLKKEMIFFFKGMKRYSILAKDVIERFETNLDNSSYKLLYTLSKKNKTLTDKCYLVFNKHFCKYGIVKNLVFKILILLGKV